jgi:hypothetical protein
VRIPVKNYATYAGQFADVNLLSSFEHFKLASNYFREMSTNLVKRSWQISILSESHFFVIQNCKSIHKLIPADILRHIGLTVHEVNNASSIFL